MALGPGKYDHLCSEVREKAEAMAVIVIIFDGNKGSGFSCQAPPEVTHNLPKILRHVAGQIEDSSEFRMNQN